MAQKAKKTGRGALGAEIAAGLVAAGTAAAAGYYFYADNHAKKHRKLAAKWANDMKKEVVQQAKKMRATGAKDFSKIVDNVSKTYQGVRAIQPSDVKLAATELKANWEKIQREAKIAGMKTVKKVVKKATKKAAKKAVKKAPAKKRAR